MPNFICPNCGHRLVGAERTAGFTQRARGCEKCGFGFLFELLDDYYPAPNAAFFVCDAEGLVIACGRGSRELTGLGDADVMGRAVGEVLGLDFADDGDPIATALEGGAGVVRTALAVPAQRGRAGPTAA